MRLDPVTFEVLRNALANMCDEGSEVDCAARLRTHDQRRPRSLLRSADRGWQDSSRMAIAIRLRISDRSNHRFARSSNGPKTSYRATSTSLMIPTAAASTLTTLNLLGRSFTRARLSPSIAARVTGRTSVALYPGASTHVRWIVTRKACGYRPCGCSRTTSSTVRS